MAGSILDLATTYVISVGAVLCLITPVYLAARWLSRRR